MNFVHGLLEVLLMALVAAGGDDFELEATDSLVECVQCVQMWRSASQKESRACSNDVSTCRGTACFMRQCKHCPVYQYMSGCVQLTPWQLSELEMNRRNLELRMRRIGAVLLCEDTFNQTTRDKCNSIHSRLPYTTYSDGLFKGVVNFDHVIGDLDPRYLEVMSGYHYRFLGNVSNTQCLTHCLSLLMFFTYVASKLTLS